MAVTEKTRAIDVLRNVFNRESPIPSEAARWVLALEFTEAEKERMLLLADLGNRGELSSVEREEMEAFRDAGSFLTLLHAMARWSLHQAGLNPEP